MSSLADMFGRLFLSVDNSIGVAPAAQWSRPGPHEQRARSIL
ncbi:hypothetical protein [Sphingomonas alpina]|nr:hypothetical protein [Sphingomonas alpina]